MSAEKEHFQKPLNTLKRVCDGTKLIDVSPPNLFEDYFGYGSNICSKPLLWYVLIIDQKCI